MSFVRVEKVWKSYGRRPVLERIDLSVPEGQFVAVVGTSGCGKSTFLRLLLAEERPTRGRIRIAGAEPAREPGRDRGIVFQQYSVFPHLTVRDNLVAAEELAHAGAVGRFLWGRRRRAAARADAVLARIGLGHVAGSWPAALSGGMRQRLAIAQALAGTPRILLLDEPFGALDPGTRLAMHDFLNGVRGETGMTVFMVTHDLGEGFKLGDRVLVFDKPRWDPDDPHAWGATVTFDLDARTESVPPLELAKERPSDVPAPA